MVLMLFLLHDEYDAEVLVNPSWHNFLEIVDPTARADVNSIGHLDCLPEIEEKEERILISILSGGIGLD